MGKDARVKELRREFIRKLDTLDESSYIRLLEDQLMAGFDGREREIADLRAENLRLTQELLKCQQEHSTAIVPAEESSVIKNHIPIEIITNSRGELIGVHLVEQDVVLVEQSRRIEYELRNHNAHSMLISLLHGVTMEGDKQRQHYLKLAGQIMGETINLRDFAISELQDTPMIRADFERTMQMALRTENCISRYLESNKPQILFELFDITGAHGDMIEWLKKLRTVSTRGIAPDTALSWIVEKVDIIREELNGKSYTWETNIIPEMLYLISREKDETIQEWRYDFEEALRSKDALNRLKARIKGGRRRRLEGGNAFIPLPSPR